MTQLDFLSPAPSRVPTPRCVAVTSRKAYDELKPTLAGRELFVIGELLAYEREHGMHPTAYELVRFAQSRWPDQGVDVNTVRPRLTNMSHDRERNGRPKRVLVAKVAQRPCGVKGKTAWTWRVL